MIVICRITSDLSEAPDFRLTLKPSGANRLRAWSQVMAGKPVAVRRERVCRINGWFAADDIARLNVALAFVMGLAD